MADMAQGGKFGEGLEGRRGGGLERDTPLPQPVQRLGEPFALLPRRIGGICEERRFPVLGRRLEVGDAEADEAHGPRLSVVRAMDFNCRSSKVMSAY